MARIDPGAALLPLAGRDHFSILEDLAQPGGVIVGALEGLR
jgi:hypothetical protein